MGCDVKTLSIARAIAKGTLTLDSKISERFKEPYWIIGDEYGIIEIALSEKEADDRIFEVDELFKITEGD